MVKKKIEDFKTPKNTPAVEVELWPISRPKIYARNAKKHPQNQIDLLARIIERHGFDQPIVVDAKGVIIKGHGRLLAAKQLGLTTVPVIVRDDLTPVQAAEARIADNRVAEFGWDFDALVADVVGHLNIGLDMSTIGFSLKEFGLEKDAGDINTTWEPDTKRLDAIEPSDAAADTVIKLTVPAEQADAVRALLVEAIEAAGLSERVKFA